MAGVRTGYLLFDIIPVIRSATVLDPQTTQNPLRQFDDVTVASSVTWDATTNSKASYTETSPNSNLNTTSFNASDEVTDSTIPSAVDQLPPNGGLGLGQPPLVTLVSKVTGPVVFVDVTPVVGVTFNLTLTFGVDPADDVSIELISDWLVFELSV